MTVKKSIRGLASLLFAISIFFVVSSFSDKISEGVLRGLNVAVLRVIPTTIPFMIISDLFERVERLDEIPLLAKIYEVLFGLPRSTMPAVIIGNIFGFPLGARLISKSFTRGEISIDVAERAVALASMPSVAFIIGVVGKGMLGDAGLGLTLYVICAASNLLAAQIFRRRWHPCQINSSKRVGKFNFVSSVKEAGITSIYIISFISIFSLFVFAAESLIPGGVVRDVSIAVIEVSRAAEYFSDAGMPISSSLPFIAFSLSFGGISVACQTSVFTNEAGLSIKKYLIIKSISAVISYIVSIIYFLLV